MHGCRDPSFLVKKNLLPTEKEERQINPVANESVTYLSMGSCFDMERLYKQWCPRKVDTAIVEVVRRQGEGLFLPEWPKERGLRERDCRGRELNGDS